MQEIIIATANKHKVEEFREILKDWEVKSLLDIGLEDLEIDETGKTFEENALIKSRTVCNLIGKTVLADDSGLVIDFLRNGEPGIYSSRYLGKDTPYIEKNKIILDRMKNATDRKARFVCAMSISFDDGHDVVVKGIFEGEISKSICGENGFGYDPIFYVPEYKKTSAELSPDEKNKISHRRKALNKVLAVLLKEGNNGN